MCEKFIVLRKTYALMLGRDAKLNQISILQNILSYIWNIAAEKENSILEEMKSRLYYKAQEKITPQQW